MALGDPYATSDQLEERLDRLDDGTFERLVDAASRAVESFTRRQFNRSDEALPRRFRALDRERVRVDDFHTLDGLEVVVNGVPWDVDTQVDARPWDGLINGQVAWSFAVDPYDADPYDSAGGGGMWPYSDLFAIGRRWPWSRRALVTVTAQWGWASVPSAIIEATLDVAEVMSMGMGQQSRFIRSESIGGYAISYGVPTFGGVEDVPQELIKALPFRRKQFGVA